MEKLVLQELIILKKIENLKNDLAIIGAEMELLRKFPKTQQKDFSSPSSSQSEHEAIPGLTATGKESTNPLKVVNLPKIQTEVQTSKTLEKSSDLNLRPNGGIQIPSKTKEQSLDIESLNSKNFYVVYNGPNAGIYNNWGIASTATQGFSGTTCKKFKTLQEAKVSAHLYTTEMLKPTLQLISSAENLKPSFSQALRKTNKSLTILGKDLSKKPIEDFKPNQENGETIYDSFRYFYELGRSATEKHFEEYRFFTTKKKDISYFNFYPNSNAEMIYEAFVNGLVSLIYPSKNLIEISHFPKEIRNSIKQFRTKCLKNSEKDIFLKISSTIPFWNNDELIKPFHFIQIGIVKERLYSPSEPADIRLNKNDLMKIAFQKYSGIIENLFCYPNKGNIHINFANVNFLILSQSHSNMTGTEKAILHNIQSKMINGIIMFGSHYPQMCSEMVRVLKKTKAEMMLNCPHCTKSPQKDKQVAEDKDSGDPTNQSDCSQGDIPTWP